MRLVTGATKRSNIAKLFYDTGWQPVSKRRDQAMLVMLYKVKKGMAPLYLRSLIPENQTIVHDLRNKRDIREPSFNTEVYKRSFFSTAIRLWNTLDNTIQEAASIDIFKCKIRADKKEGNVLFYYGKRWPAIHHARLRIGCSKLNFDVCFHLHIFPILTLNALVEKVMRIQSTSLCYVHTLMK